MCQSESSVFFTPPTPLPPAAFKQLLLYVFLGERGEAGCGKKRSLSLPFTSTILYVAGEAFSILGPRQELLFDGLRRVISQKGAFVLLLCLFRNIRGLDFSSYSRCHLFGGDGLQLSWDDQSFRSAVQKVSLATLK